MCPYPDAKYSNTRVKWYRQSVGDTPTLITMLMKATTNPTFEEGFPSERFDANYTESASNLTILRTIQADEAAYQCVVSTWNKEQWKGTYLSFQSNEQIQNRSI